MASDGVYLREIFLTTSSLSFECEENSEGNVISVLPLVQQSRSDRIVGTSLETLTCRTGTRRRRQMQTDANKLLYNFKSISFVINFTE